jgi:hypothetical protein
MAGRGLCGVSKTSGGELYRGLPFMPGIFEFIFIGGEELHGMPVGVCMWFEEIAENITERLGGRRVTREEALEIVDRCEEAGLIHRYLSILKALARLRQFL